MRAGAKTRDGDPLRAVTFDGGSLSYDADFPDPAHDGESLVRVDLAGICGTDLEILDGYMGYCGIPGHEFVGTVMRSTDPGMVGRRVVGEINAACGMCAACARGEGRHCPGRTVLGILNRNGAFAQYLSLPTQNLHAVPDTVSDEQAVFVEPLAAAFEIAEQVRIRAEWRSAIIGDGRLAQLVASVLLLRCGDVTCFGRHKNKLARMRGLGVKTRIGMGATDEHAFDLAVEATGGRDGFADMMRAVRPRGVAVLKSTVASRSTVDLSPAIINEVTMVGSRCGPFRPAIEALSAGSVSVDGMIDSVYPLDGFAEAFERAKKPGVLKVLLRPWPATAPPATR